MTCTFSHPVKRLLTNGSMSGNPVKKIRLDLHNRADGGSEKDDLWGADDLTAEEFDMLEVQATQSCNQTLSTINHNPLPSTSTHVGMVNVTQVDDLKQLQYELEGRIKLLSYSLDKSAKELNEERLNREKIINDRMKAFQQRENDLKKNIEKLQSILEFKEQEMKSVYSKLTVIKSQTQDKKNASPEKSVHKNFEELLMSSKPNQSVNEIIKIVPANKFQRKHKLVVDSSRGKTESVEILSSMLCNKLSVPTFSTSQNETDFSFVKESFNDQNCSPLCVIQFQHQGKCDELLEYYKSCLKHYILNFQAAASRNNVGSSTKTSPVSLRKKGETDLYKNLIPCLRDTMHILTFLKLDSVLQNLNDSRSKSASGNQFNEEQLRNKTESNSGNSKTLNLVSEIVESLLTLVNPKTFPDGYHQTEVIELSLSALLNLSLESPKVFLRCVSNLPIYSLLSPDHSVSSLCITLKLLTSLSSMECFSSYLSHKDSGCILCTIAMFMCNTLLLFLEKYAVSMILLLDFLSSVLSVHSLILDVTPTNPCMTEIIKSLITLVWKYCQLKEQNSCTLLIVKKGFLLLHFMSSCIPGFKERRCQVEDEYISLMSNILAFSKEKQEFQECYDLIHNLWDFQTDISEFDIDEGSDEAPSSANEMDIVDSN